MSRARQLIEFAIKGEETPSPRGQRFTLKKDIVDVECWNFSKGETGTIPAGTSIEVQNVDSPGRTTIQVQLKEGILVQSNGKTGAGWRFIVPNDVLSDAIGVEIPNDIDVAGMLMAFDQGELNKEEIISLFQNLVSTGTIKSLEGRYARFANQLIEKGLIKGKKLER